MDVIDVDAVARSAKRRRARSRAAVFAAGVLAVAGVAALAVVLPGRSPSAHPSLPLAGGLSIRDRGGIAVQLAADVTASTDADPAAEAAVAQAEQAFTLTLLKQAGAAGRAAAKSQNVVLSPSSLAIALSMLQNGANGSTRDEIAAALRTSHLTDARQNAGWSTLSADLAAAGAADGLSVESANSLWVQQGLQMRAGFMAAMGRSYRAGVWQVDFAHALSAANKAINSWTAQHTHGKITKLFEDGALDPSTLLVLANAVYFKAAWQTPFDAGRTAPGQFTLSDGSTSTVPFMSSEVGQLRVTSTPQLDAVQLPYKGGRFAALVVMPKQQPLSDFVGGLTTAQLDQVVNAMAVQPAAVDLPKVKATTYTQLNGTLAAMGMPTAFTDNADFSRLSPTPAKVSKVVQRDYLAIDEKGTEAAAVTGVQMVPTSAFGGRSVRFDHPFLFLVRDTKTGAVLFSAEVQNPAG